MSGGPPSDSKVAWHEAYADIPREVLDVLARHFGQRQENLTAELTAARRRITELERSLNSAPQPAHAPLLNANRKMEAELAQLKEHAAARIDELQTAVETAQRQRRTAEGTVDDLQAALTESQQQLASVKQTFVDTESVATKTAERITELEKKLAAAEAAQTASAQDAASHAKKLGEHEQTIASLRRTLDEGKDETEQFKRQLTRATEANNAQAEQIRTLERARQDAEEESDDSERERRRTAAQHIDDLQTHLIASSTNAERQLATLTEERDRLLRENQSLGENQRSAWDDARLSWLAEQTEATGLIAYTHEFPTEAARIAAWQPASRDFLRWSTHTLARMGLSALLTEDKPLDLRSWARQAPASLARVLRDSRTVYPDAFRDFVRSEERLLGFLAGVVLAGIAVQLSLSRPLLPTPAVAAAPTNPRRQLVDGVATPRDARPAPVSIPRSVTASPTLTKKVRSEPSAAPTSSSRVEAMSQPSPAWQYDPKQDRLVSAKLDELSQSHRLATLEDTLGVKSLGRAIPEGRSLFDQAIEAASTARMAYADSPPATRITPITWVRYRYQLDEESERDLRSQSVESLIDLEARYRMLGSRERRR